MEISKIAVNGTEYAIKDTVTSINGKSGAIGASDIASVLTEAGYKLTDKDTTYQFAQSGNSLQMGTDNGTKSTIYTPTLTKGDKGDKGDGVTSATQTTSSTASSGKNTVTFKVGSTVVGSIDVYNGAKGDKGDTGASGSNGSNGVSCTHSWNGTTLTVTSASGTSSANLKGDTGATGPQGPQGIQGILGPKGDDGLTTQITVNGNTYTLSSGNITLPNYPTSLPASDVYAWAKASAKPTYIANEVMSISAVAISANTSSSCSITGSGNAGKAQTIIYTNSGSSDLTVTVPTDYSTPDGAAIELTCKAGGYCEVSYLNIGGTIYARGL